jgi:AraC family ethanolamine operon transcriptional activator
MLCEVVTFGLDQPRQWPPPTTRAYIVERAVEFMRPDLANPPLMAEICDAVRVCPRTLRYSFEDVVGVSPNRFMVFLRLDRARRELIAAGPGGCVQLVAHRDDFSNQSRFASSYQRAFGELPSATCKRLQVTAKPGSRSRSRSCGTDF